MTDRAAPPSPLEARLQALAIALERHVAEAEAELPAMPPAQAERCRQAVLAVAHQAATLARVAARHMPPPPLGDPDHRPEGMPRSGEPGEEP